MDDIATEVIEKRLLSALTALFTPITTFEMNEQLVTEIAGESEESQSLREQLNKKLWILIKGSEICRRFVGIRGIGKWNELQTKMFPSLTICPENDVGAEARKDQEELSDDSYDSLALPEEVAPHSETEEEELRAYSPTYSPPLPGDVPEAEDDNEKDTAELGQPKIAVSSTSARRKKKSKATSKPRTSVDIPSGRPID